MAHKMCYNEQRNVGISYEEKTLKCGFVCIKKIDQYLIEWKSDPDHLPLIIKGARQIGKTESILYFAESNYKRSIPIWRQR